MFSCGISGVIKMATAETQFRKALKALMEGLVRAAVVEICAMAETWSASLRMEITMSKSENDDLKRKVQMLEQRLSDRTAGQQSRKSKLPESGKWGHKTVNPEIEQTGPSGGQLCSHALREIKLEEMEMSVTGKPGTKPHAKLCTVVHEPLFRGSEISEKNYQSSELGSESVSMTEPGKCKEGISIDCDSETCDSEHEPDYQRTQNIHLTLPKKKEEQVAKTDDELEWVDSSCILAHGLQQNSTSLFHSESSSADHRVILEKSVNLSTTLSNTKHSELSHKAPGPSNKTKKKGPRWICNICGKSLSSKYSLSVHFTLHTGERPHACPQCGKKFVNRTNLQIHQNIHTGEKPYACSLCPKSFADPSPFKRHLGMHCRELQQSDHGPKSKFICTVCGKSLSTKQGLRYHLTKHTGERPFICPWCGKSFVQKQNLKIHQNIHTGAKPYVCTLCQKSFADPSSLKKHKRMHM